MICVFDGPEHTFQFVNPPYQALVGPRPLVGRPIAEAMPELVGQPIFGLLDKVYRTGETFRANEMLVQLDHGNEGLQVLEKRYYNFTYQARHSAAGAIDGIFVFAYDVTPQVLVREQVQLLNEELAATNEELQAANEESLRGNTELLRTQQLLEQRNHDLYYAQAVTEQLNNELENRVAERTQQLQQQQALLRQILGQVPASIATLSGPEHRYSFFNDEYQRLSGQRTYLGLTVAEVFPEVADQGFVALLDQVYATGEPFVGTEMPAQLYSPATGKPEAIFVDLIYQPLRDAQGQPNGILAFIIESTEKVRTRQASEATAHRLLVLTDAMPVLISYIDREQRYQFANHAYRRWFGQDPASLLGRTILEVVGPDAYRAVHGYIARALAGEQLEFEARMPYRKDLVRHIHTNYIPDVHEGELRGFYALVTDITDQVLAREQVQELNEELAAINEEMLVANEELRDTNNRLIHTNVDLDTFVYTASHDLKAPISNIEGLLLALREQLPAAVSQAEDVAMLLDLMHGSVARFQRTIGQLTDVSKLQQAHSEPAEAVDLAALANALRLDLAPALGATGGQLIVDVSECPTVRFSPKNLRSILYNLLSNAIKYQMPGRPPQVWEPASE